MKKLIIFTFVFIFMSLFLFNCSVPNTEVNKSNLTASVKRVVDYEAGVACWTFYTYQGGGISCLPISETLLNNP